MPDTLPQRVLSLAYAGFAPPDIALFLGLGERAVIADLADLTLDGTTQEQRILNLVLAGHHLDDVVQWLGCPVATAFTALQDLGRDGPRSDARAPARALRRPG